MGTRAGTRAGTRGLDPRKNSLSTSNYLTDILFIKLHLHRGTTVSSVPAARKCTTFLMHGCIWNMIDMNDVFVKCYKKIRRCLSIRA